MSMKRSYAVFGLGRYGYSVAKTLAKSGAEVLVVDKNERLVNSAVGELPLCKCGDITDPEVIKNLGVSNFDVVIIAIAESLEASVMATLLCKEAGVGEIIVKCSSEIHRKILLGVGADKVVFPEYEAGARLAQNLMSSGFVDMIELSSDLSITEIAIKKEWTGKTLRELSLRNKYGINVVALISNGVTKVDIDPDIPLSSGDGLIVIANPVKLGKLVSK